jgi:hypothetical protein
MPETRFEEHDVTVMPLPSAPAGLIYGRLVLAHLPNPPATVDGWRRQLAPGGTMLLEELEGIDAPVGPLRDYEELSAEIVRHGGGVMYAGPLLSSLGGSCVRVTVSATHAATISCFNVRRWLAEGSSWVPAARLVELEAALSRLASARDDGTVSWVVRQIRVQA